VAREPETTFLIESYVPQLDERTATTISSRLRDAIRELEEEGVTLHWRGSFALVEEETYLCLVVAPDRESVLVLNRRAALASDHVAEIATIDAPSESDRIVGFS
jgi:hypothetical protein